MKMLPKRIRIGIEKKVKKTSKKLQKAVDKEKVV